VFAGSALFFVPQHTARRRSIFAQDLSIYGLTVQTVRRVMKRLAGFFDRPLEAGILRAVMAVHVVRNIPRLLVGQRVALSQRHVVFDEGCRIGYAVHAGAPVKGFITPERREYHLSTGLLSGTIRAV